MSLTKNEQTKLLAATKELDESFQKIFVQLLIELCESYAWFKEYLFAAVDTDLSFVRDRIDSAGGYDFIKHKVFISNSLLPESPSSIMSPLMIFYRYLLRHEITHSNDFLAKRSGNPIQIKSTVQRLLQLNKIANSLFDALACIDNYAQLDHEILKAIGNVLAINPNDSAGYLMASEINLITANQMQTIIDHLGFFPRAGMYSGKITDLTYYIIELWHTGVGNQFIYNITMNPQFIEANIETIGLNKKNINLASLEESLLFTKNAKQLNLWQNLNKQQQAILERLYLLRFRMYAAVPPDPICIPKINNCISNNRMGCLNTFLNCQQMINPDNYISSASEIHAVSKENTENFDQLTSKMLLSLCSSEKKSTAQSAHPISHKNENIFHAESTPTTTFLWTGINSFLFSFIDELGQIYLAAKGLTSPFYKVLINAGYTIFYYSMLSYFTTNKEEIDTAAWQMSFSIAFALIRCGLELAKEQKFLPQTGRWINYLLTAGIFVPQTVLEGPLLVVKTIGTSIVGSTAGSLVAASMTRTFGWYTPHQIIFKEMQEILKGTNTKDYQPFIDAIKEKNYAKALRNACNSTNIKAFDLARLLVVNKERLHLNINEQAGENNRSALHYAGLKGNEKLYNYLVVNGADENALDSDNNTARQYLTRYTQAALPSLYPY